jgi:carbon storage regulator
MLVLTRKIGQQVLIDNGLIQMKVLRVNDDIISIGFNAPSHIEIDREEVYLKKLVQRSDLLTNGTLA